ncbi:MAG: hypothetical protein Q4E24_01630 [bacterium]|nr:hypothetical protein [bacterium]
MAKVCGTPEEARKLAGEIKKITRDVIDTTGELKKQMQSISGGLRDGREQEIEIMCNSINKALLAAIENVAATMQHLEAYAVLLETKYYKGN